LEAKGKSIEANLLEKEREITGLKENYEQDMKAIRDEMNRQFSQIMLLIQQNPGLAHIKTDVLSKKIKEY
jgi:integrase/recombinase XerD